MTDGDSMTINNLCDSSKGTFVTLDDYLPLTEDGSRVAIDWVTGQSYSSARRRLNIQSGKRKGGKCAAAPA